MGKITRVRILLSSAFLLVLTLRASAQEPPTAADTATAPAEERSIELFNTHTGETAKVVFKRGAEYDKDALDQLKKVLIDHRSGDVHDMDPALYDQLFDLAAAAGVPPSYEIISGYRSPDSNSKMAAKSGSGVAKGSLHMQGRAIDVRLKGCTVEKLRDLALAAKRGGVGYYQRSQFVHIDTGSFRTWIG